MPFCGFEVTQLLQLPAVTARHGVQ